MNERTRSSSRASADNAETTRRRCAILDRASRLPSHLRKLPNGPDTNLASDRDPQPVSEGTTVHGAFERPDARPGERILRVIGTDLFDTHVLPASGRVVLGRSSEADVNLPHSSVSRRHAVLHLGPAIEIEDLGSANGTLVGLRALSAGEKVAIALGEPVTIGAISVVVQRGAAMPELVLEDDAMRALHQLVERVAPSTINVLVVGETGVGKDVVATRVHDRSNRRDEPLVTINCAAFSESLLESELFGYEKGAFTGAASAKAGLLESAEGGTVFLDEIGELPMALQPKLLRVIEDRQVRRVGALKAREIDVRFIAATNRDLEEEIERGRFRQDLYFRLNGVTLEIPPLRSRVSEIGKLAKAFIASAARDAGRPPPTLTKDALRLLEGYRWPGNIRELRNFVERAVLLAPGPTISPEHLPVDKMGAAAGTSRLPPSDAQSGPATDRRPSAPPRDVEGAATLRPPELTGGVASDLRSDELREALREADKQRIAHALHQCGGNQSQAAKLLGISRNTLLARLDAHGLPRPRKK